MKSCAKLLSFIFILFINPPFLDAQIEQKVCPDRPFISKTAFVVPVGTFGFETGFVYEKTQYTSSLLITLPRI